ncbi:GNAT family N-acetyltransferase [Halobacillus yeomjeoni]|uniref:GNAT family N-acetyltransferase n=1 Tax=Halobacillus yeomjeoni TaxID=311194 RepID=A0A931HV57_9BACI|nr:GNAT family N-acetyltransferase [Halobacillus yeomjeoni]MBH0230257.1 GNAT family N-acetyltransferase [Halobacillus yeomjeoni]
MGVSIQLETDRLHLKPYSVSQAEKVSELAGDKEVAATTFVPHPYTVDHAMDWIRSHEKWFDEGKAYPMAMTLKESGDLVGTMTLRIDTRHNKGELAYWVGRPFWNQGLATEAAERMIEYGFEVLNLQRIWAAALSGNPGSTKVMQKAGLSYEGTLRKDLLHRDEYKDIDVYGLIRDDLHHS